jgi:hypothetical protein
MASDQLIQNKSREITSEYWSEWVTLSLAKHNAYQIYSRSGKKWGLDFINSIMANLGYKTDLKITRFKSMEEAELNWEENYGTFPILNKKPKSVSDLTQRQQSILKLYL